MDPNAETGKVTSESGADYFRAQNEQMQQKMDEVRLPSRSSTEESQNRELPQAKPGEIGQHSVIAEDAFENIQVDDDAIDFDDQEKENYEEEFELLLHNPEVYSGLIEDELISYVQDTLATDSKYKSLVRLLPTYSKYLYEGVFEQYDKGDRSVLSDRENAEWAVFFRTMYSLLTKKVKSLDIPDIVDDKDQYINDIVEGFLTIDFRTVDLTYYTRNSDIDNPLARR